MPILKRSSDLARVACSARHRLAACLLTATAFLGLTPAAAADPVTAVFDVSVFQRWDYARQGLEPFSSSFQLTLQFDQSSSLFIFPNEGRREYGDPTFSPVPSELVVASRPAGMETIVRQQTMDQWWRSGDVYHRASIASIQESDPSFGNQYSAGIMLTQPSVGGGLPAPPELTTESFLRHLGAGNTINFLYTGYAVTDTPAGRIFAANSYQYQGIATLVRFDIPGGEAPSPVPEPGSMLLLGSGLAGLAYRRRHRARGHAEPPAADTAGAP